MRIFTLQVREEDYPFIIAAIKLRTTSLVESFAMQVEGQLKIEQQAQQPQEESQTPVRDWTVSHDGKGGLVAKLTRKRKKFSKAPYGLKKDGTPKAKPGRKA